MKDIGTWVNEIAVMNGAERANLMSALMVYELKGEHTPAAEKAAKRTYENYLEEDYIRLFSEEINDTFETEVENFFMTPSDFFQKKIDDGIFTDFELQCINNDYLEAIEDFEEVEIVIMDRQYDENSHMEMSSRGATTVFKFKNRFYAIDWEQGLGKYSEDYFEKQPYEVKRQEELRIVARYIKEEDI